MFEFNHRLRIVSVVLGAAVLVTFASTGCVTHHYSRGPSVYSVKAPPRTAAHGYAHHYRDAVLVFDRSWNGYWVRSHPNHYFHSNHYYRWQGSRWHRARHIRGPWVSVELRAVPSGLHHRGPVKHRRDERRGAVRERREEPRKVTKVYRAKRREVAKVKREVAKVKREVAKVKREVTKVKREKRREVAEPRKTRQVAKAAKSTAGVSRSWAKHRRRKVRKDEDEELLANRRVR